MPDEKHSGILLEGRAARGGFSSIPGTARPGEFLIRDPACGELKFSPLLAAMGTAERSGHREAFNELLRNGKIGVQSRKDLHSGRPARRRWGTRDVRGQETAGSVPSRHPHRVQDPPHARVQPLPGGTAPGLPRSGPRPPPALNKDGAARPFPTHARRCRHVTPERAWPEAAPASGQWAEPERGARGSRAGRALRWGGGRGEGEREGGGASSPRPSARGRCGTGTGTGMGTGTGTGSGIGAGVSARPRQEPRGLAPGSRPAQARGLCPQAEPRGLAGGGDDTGGLGDSPRPAR